MNYTIEELKKVIPELREKDQEILFQENYDPEEFTNFSIKCYEIIKILAWRSFYQDFQEKY